MSFCRRPRKIDLLEARWRGLNEVDRRRAHRLLYAWLRERGRAAVFIQPRLARKTRLETVTLLELAVVELQISAGDRHPAVVDHAVSAARELLSRSESRLVNALLRRILPQLQKDWPSLRHSHPDWLVQRWIREFGEESVEALLRWNQRDAEWTVRLSPAASAPEDWQETPWPPFYRVASPGREAALKLVQEGLAYIQDPFTRHPVELALAHAPRRVLDLCAAPGGKTRALLDHPMAAQLETIVAVDLPGERLDRLRENLSASPHGERVQVIGADVAKLTAKELRAAAAPVSFDCVILDVPCSNTGVIRRRPDVRWVLDPGRITELAALQVRLLENAARFVAPGASLIYSTCSIEAEENAQVVEGFLRAHPGFRLRESRMSLPWQDAHDGGGAFHLTRHPAKGSS